MRKELISAPMRVKDLVKQLSKLDQNKIVICQSDPEGNNFSPLYSIWEGAYKNGEAGIDELTDEDLENGYTDEDVIKNGKKAIFLVPLH